MVLGFLGMIGHIVPVSWAQDKPAAHQSPYFQVAGKEGVEQFPLLGTKVHVNIAGVVAYVEFIQTYKNEGNKTIEAMYVFPLGAHAAINRMQMKIADRVITAKIEEKETAKNIYETAKNAGQIASLLRQQRPNVFQMNVANIMPGDMIEVTVHYTELIVPQNSTYEFVFPTVVGPRYNGEVKDPEKENPWVAMPYLRNKEEVPYDIDIEVTLNTPVAVDEVWVPSHNVTVEEGDLYTRVKLSEEVQGGNRDFILRYALKGNQIQTGLMLYPGEKENFFLLMVQPPKRVEVRDVPPREYVFVVDVSGSMNGFPLEVSKTLIRNILNDLNGKDYFNIVFFAGGSRVLSPYPLPVTPDNIRQAIAMLDSQQGGGGTNLLSALTHTLALEKKEGVSRTVVIATDGYISVEKEAFDMISKRIGDANCFTFGIGASTNRYLIEGLARAGSGAPFVATDQREAQQLAETFLTYVSWPVLTDIKVEYRGFEAYDVGPEAIGDLFAMRPLIVYGKYKNPEGEIVVTGNTAGGPYRRVIKVTDYKENETNSALRYLWAREKIARLSDYASVGMNVKDQVAELGLKYSLMTEYTSFVAVDTVVRETGEVVTVKQPLPLPQGVSELALEERGSFPQACFKSVAGSLSLSRNDMAAAPEVKAESSHLVAGNGVFPQGWTQDRFDTLIDPVKSKLEDLFRKWSLKKVTLEMKTDSHGIIWLKVAGFTGKECHQADLTGILNQVPLPQGYIRVVLEYR